MRARRDSNPRSQPSEGCALSSYATGARRALPSRVGRRPGARYVLEQIELVIDQCPVKFTNAIRMPEEIRTRVGKVFSRTVGHVMRDFDLFHLRPIDRMRTKIAGKRRHVRALLAAGVSALLSGPRVGTTRSRTVNPSRSAFLN